MPQSIKNKVELNINFRKIFLSKGSRIRSLNHLVWQTWRIFQTKIKEKKIPMFKDNNTLVSAIFLTLATDSGQTRTPS